MVKQTLEDWQIEDAKRLERLWNDRRPKGMTQEKFGIDYDLGSQANVGHYLKGNSKLNLFAVGQFAKMLGVKIDEISPTLADQVRELHRNCDATRNRDYGVTPETKEFIHRAIQEEMERQQKKNGGPSMGNGNSV
jgi:hypothetical protein